MPLAAHHSLFHRPWIWPNFEHFEIVIGFQHEQIGAAQMEFDRIRHVTEIRDQADLDAVRAKAESNRIDGVVRDSKAIDVDIADGEGGPGLKAIEFRSEFAPGDGR